MKHKIDPHLKEKLNQPQPPPADAWAYIQANLPEKRKKPLWPIWFRVSGIAVVFLAAIGGYFILEQNATPLVLEDHSLKRNTISIQNNPSQSMENAVENSTETSFHSGFSAVLDQNNQNDKNLVNFSKNNRYNATPSNDHPSIPMNLAQHSKDESEQYGAQFEALTNPKTELSPLVSTKQSNIDWNLVNNWKKSAQSSHVSDMELDHNGNEDLIVFELSNQKEKKPKKHVIDKRFTISGFVSPTSMNSFVGNSMLSDDMRNFKTENNITVSYGVKGAYAVAPKVKLRTGFSVIGFEQFTRNVPLVKSNAANNPMASKMKVDNISYKSNTLVGYANHQTGLNTELNQPMNGDMQQQSQYLEIPLEAEMSILETSSIGISATGGGSTWLLSKNKIYVHSEGTSEELGRANNLNKASFSANAGLKFDLKVTDHVKLNVEPHFKYLINTVSDIEKFNPYVVGVNAGVSIDLK